MSDQQPPVQVVQCPKCGSPVEAGRPGAITACSYCGSPLQLSVGASGHPIARLANIETSTVYLARTEQLKRVREQVADRDFALERLREAYDQDYEALEEKLATSTRLMTAMGGIVGGLIVSAVIERFPLIPAVLLCGFVCWIVASSWSGRKLAELEQAHVDKDAPITAERDQLAARVAELEAGLDQLADQL